MTWSPRPSCVGVAASDIDNDGSVDLFCCAGSSASASALMFTGTGSFPTTTRQLAGVFCTGVALGDVDNNGDVDVVVTNGVTTSLILTTGAGAFSAAVATWPRSYGLAVVDANGDGALDIPAVLALSPIAGFTMVREGVAISFVVCVLVCRCLA